MHFFQITRIVCYYLLTNIYKTNSFEIYRNIFIIMRLET